MTAQEKVDDYEARFRRAYDNKNWQEAVAVWGECGRNDKDLTVKLHARIRNELLELLLDAHGISPFRVEKPRRVGRDFPGSYKKDND